MGLFIIKSKYNVEKIASFRFDISVAFYFLSFVFTAETDGSLESEAVFFPHRSFFLEKLSLRKEIPVSHKDPSDRWVVRSYSYGLPVIPSRVRSAGLLGPWRF